MNRADALTYLNNQYDTLATEIGMGTTDSVAGYKLVMDFALRELGYSSAEYTTADVPADKEADYVALLKYYALDKLVELYALKYNYTIDGQSHQESVMFTNLKALLDRAEKKVADLGYAVGSDSQLTLTGLRLDFLEPSGL